MATVSGDPPLADAAPLEADGTGRLSAASWLALLVLVAANALNYLDRQIVSILAQSIKADLRLDDADLGFILGTAFAVFYSVVGIAMGRISDFVSRKKLMAFGLALWSAMTALGGAAGSFAVLAFARIGVGIGEAVANPCGHSLVADLFPKRMRALTLSLLLAGTFIGGAMAMFLGGWFVQNWEQVCGNFAFGPGCGLKGWQAALFAVGLPGLPLALLLLFIHEPARPLPQGQSTTQIAVTEISAALPPLTFAALRHAGGSAAMWRNLGLGAAIVLIAAVLARWTGDVAQWAACGIGAYAIITWGQVQSYRDAPLFAVTFGNRTFLMAVSATALIACVNGAAHVWAAPYAMRHFDLKPADLGLKLGVLSIGGGLLGVIAGGWLTDRLRAKDMRAPMIMGAISLAGAVPAVVLMLLAKDANLFFAAALVQGAFAACWSGSTAALVQDLVLPRMRGAAAASYSLVAIVVSSGIGPYWTGKVSALTGSLNAGLFSILLLALPALALLWLTARRLPHETPEARRALATAAGEPQ